MTITWIFLEILGIYSLLIIILGAIGNIVTILVCMRSKNNTNFILFQYLSANNLIAVSFWSFCHFIDSQYNIDFQSYSMFICKFGSWIQFSSLQASAWILVFIFYFKIFKIFFSKIKFIFEVINIIIKIFEL